MDAIIRTKLENGYTARICQRCMLFTDQGGNPDPVMYSAKALAKFAKIPPDKRCPHRRATEWVAKTYETMISIHITELTRSSPKEGA